MATEEMATHKQIALVFKQTKKKNQPPKLVETLNDFLKYALVYLLSKSTSSYNISFLDDYPQNSLILTRSVVKCFSARCWPSCLLSASAFCCCASYSGFHPSDSTHFLSTVDGDGFSTLISAWASQVAQW